MQPRLPFALLLLLLVAPGCRPGEADESPVPTPDPPQIEPFTAAELLGRPTDRSITLTVTAAQALTLRVQWGTTPGVYAAQTPTVTAAADETIQTLLDGLLPDTRYHYRVQYRAAGAADFSSRGEGTFHTARAGGSTFVFTVQADSHLDGNSDLALYKQTLANVLADAPDFHLDLGDTFMCEKYGEPLSSTARPAADAATVNTRYRYERANFALIGRSVPLFLVNGNHEGEWGRLGDGGDQNIAVWAAQARLRYFLNPPPDGFYSGDTFAEPNIGRRAAWYAWEWGDALFIVLDPYWNALGRSGNDGWSLTLGERQYRWLRETLAASRAAYRFIFLHNLVDGLDGQMRGGSEAAPYFEWGGRDPDGTMVFARKRPGWEEPIHSLLVQYGVTAVFHGHDHLYAHQELDGVVYQEVPQPSTTDSGDGARLAAQYHYTGGTIAGSAGHLRVTVGPAAVRVEYIRARLPQDETNGRRNRDIAAAYTLPRR